MHPNFMLKTSSSWFDCGVTHQIRHTLSLRVQVDLIVVLHIKSDTLYLYSKYGDVSLYQNVSDTSFPNHPAMIVKAKCARGNVSLCCLSKTHHHSLHLGSWIFFFLFFITSIKVTIRELVDVQICDQVSHHCNAMTLAIWRSTWGDEFSNMTIRTRFHPYYVTNYTFESWVNNLINLYPQPAMSSSCVSHFLKTVMGRTTSPRRRALLHKLRGSQFYCAIESPLDRFEHQDSCADRVINGATRAPSFMCRSSHQWSSQASRFSGMI